MNIQDAVNSVALAKIQADEEARALLTPGTYRVDTMVHVTGEINVGQDYSVAPTVSIPMKETLALFIHFSGITGDHAIRALVRAMQTAIATDGKGKGELSATMPIINRTMGRVQSEVINQLPRQPRKGPVTHRLTVEQVGVGVGVGV